MDRVMGSRIILIDARDDEEDEGKRESTRVYFSHG